MEPILFVHPRNDFTGSTRVLATVIAADYSDAIVTVVTEDESGKGFLSGLDNVRIIPYRRLRLRGRSIPKFTELWTWIQIFVLVLFYGKRHGMLYINTIVPFAAALAGRLRGMNIVYHIHEKFLNPDFVGRLMERVFYKTKAHHIYVSNYTRSAYGDVSGCSWEIKYNKLSKDFIAKAVPKPLVSRPRNTLLMISSLSTGKGIFNYVELARLMPDLCFRMVISADKGDIDQTFGDNLPQNIEIYPAQKDVTAFLYDTDLIINMSVPSLCVETFGMTVLEAMPFGVPAIVPNVGGPVELVENGNNGYCLDVSDLDEMVYAVRSALVEDNYNRLSNNTLQRFKEKFR